MTGHCHQFLLYLGTEGHSVPSRCFHICLSVCFSQMAGITSDSHFGIHRKRTCWIGKQSGGCLLLVDVFFFLSGLFPPCVALFPVCSVSCLSNDHFEAVSLSCVILQTHGVYVQIFPHTAWVKGDRKKKTWGRKKSKPDAGWASSPTQKAVQPESLIQFSHTERSCKHSLLEMTF